MFIAQLYVGPLVLVMMNGSFLCSFLSLVVRFQDILTHCTSPRESEPLIFHGDSGTGKTSLLAKAAAQVAGSGQGKV